MATEHQITRAIAKLRGDTPAPRKRKPRASYARAIEWLAENDDNEWLDEYERGEGTISVAAHLVADLFNKRHMDEVARDLRAALSRRGL